MHIFNALAEDWLSCLWFSVVSCVFLRRIYGYCLKIDTSFDIQYESLLLFCTYLKSVSV